MDVERWRTIERIFFEAIELDSDERDAFLAEACGPDDALKKELVGLLDAAGGEARLRIEERLTRFLRPVRPR